MSPNLATLHECASLLSNGMWLTTLEQLSELTGTAFTAALYEGVRAGVLVVDGRRVTAQPALQVAA